MILMGLTPLLVNFPTFQVYMDGGKTEYTEDEPWASEAVNWYAAACQFAVENLNGQGKCLVIGSPMFEVMALKNLGWNVTFLDVREPPHMLANRFVKGSITEAPFEDESFDALSSTCVLCHVGLGRYGDPICEDGDKVAIAEMSRVLRTGGKATIMFGPIFPGMLETVVMSNIHRIYNIAEAMQMAEDVGLECLGWKIWSMKDNCWLTNDGMKTFMDDIDELLNHGTIDFLYHCYLTALFERT